MCHGQLLWVDLRRDRSVHSISQDIGARFPVVLIGEPSQILKAVNHATPMVCCFEYDHPDSYGLKALSDTKSRVPTLPILMLTDSHSESLAVWAFRSRVWDYLVNPVESAEVEGRVETLARLLKANAGPNPRQPGVIGNGLPAEYRVGYLLLKKTLVAIDYVESHYHEKIQLRTVAKICRMDVGTFCRSFKKEHGVTFGAYLTEYRVQKALHLLKQPGASVADVAFAVGVHNPSYFTRIFAKHLGKVPSMYRAEQIHRQFLKR